MQDSEKNYPSQSIPSHDEYHSANDASLEVNDTEQEPMEIRLPSHRLRYAFITGILAGLLAALIPVIITFMNASLYQEASRLGYKMSYNTAWAITELACLGKFLALILSFVVGYMVGRIAVLRKPSLLGGALVGAITFLGDFFVHYLPNYPDKIVSNTSPSSGIIFAGILTSIVIFLIYSAMGALMALWGAWTATRKHPYYQTR